jgi:hypothetical protein
MSKDNANLQLADFYEYNIRDEDVEGILRGNSPPPRGR